MSSLFVLGAIVAVLALLAFIVYRVVTRPAPATVYGEAHETNPFRLESRTSTVRPAKTSLANTPELLEQLRNLDWFQFEQITALVYRKSGYQVEHRGGANPDGGIDLVLVDSNRQRVAVQCKHWRTWNVGVKPVRELVGAMKIAGISKGILITLKGYSLDARQTAEGNQIELVNETGLCALLESTHAHADPEVLQLLEDKRKLCPKCESELVLRTATKGRNVGNQFWGCSTYPRCRFTMACH